MIKIQQENSNYVVDYSLYLGKTWMLLKVFSCPNPLIAFNFKKKKLKDMESIK